MFTRFGFLVVAVSVSATCFGSEYRIAPRTSIRRSISLTQPTDLSIHTDDGFIEIEEVDESALSVRVENERDVEVGLVIDHLSPAHVSVYVKFTPARIFHDEGPGVHLYVKVPRTLTANLTARSGYGRLSLQGLPTKAIGSAREIVLDTADGVVWAQDVIAGGGLTLKTAGGNVFARDIAGPLVAESGDGILVVERVNGDVRAVSTYGKMSISGVRGFVFARAADGIITLDNPNATGEDVEASGKVFGRQCKEDL